jgi:NAD(P)-dependent dehydrogenase (short-subunit alcohol dehydrogenase family)
MIDLEGRVAVVTGGARGIGRAIVLRLLRAGARVAFLDVERDGGAALARELERTGGDVAFFECDVTDGRAVADVFGSIKGRFATIDVLVNNAGVNTYFDAVEMSEEDWEKTFAVDLKAVWLCSKHALPGMLDSGGGVIINIASIHAHMTTKGMFPYAAAKSGVVGLTRSLALDYGERNVRVVAVCPGWVRTHLVQEWFDRQEDPRAAERSVLAVHPLGRIGTPEDIANFVAYLASEEAAFITGVPLLIDGGLSAHFAT